MCSTTTDQSYILHSTYIFHSSIIASATINMKYILLTFYVCIWGLMIWKCKPNKNHKHRSGESDIFLSFLNLRLGPKILCTPYINTTVGMPGLKKKKKTHNADSSCRKSNISRVSPYGVKTIINSNPKPGQPYRLAQSLAPRFLFH